MGILGRIFSERHARGEREPRRNGPDLGCTKSVSSYRSQRGRPVTHSSGTGYACFLSRPHRKDRLRPPHDVSVEKLLRRENITQAQIDDVIPKSNNYLLVNTHHIAVIPRSSGLPQLRHARDQPHTSWRSALQRQTTTTATRKGLVCRGDSSAQALGALWLGRRLGHTLVHFLKTSTVPVSFVSNRTVRVCWSNH